VPSAHISLHQLHWAGILRHGRIIGEQGDPFDRRLRDQRPVKLVFVDRWQRVDGNRMLTEDR
jgi:hypothetical protein